MARKRQGFNAEFHRTALRTILGAGVVASVWWGMGWALSGEVFAALLACWSLVLAPICVPIILWWNLRLRGQLEPLRLTSDLNLAQTFFIKVLENKGLNPRIYIRTASEPSVVWFEEVFGNRQVWVISSAWFLLPAKERMADFAALWDRVAALSRPMRKLRTLQMLLWIGSTSAADLLVLLYRSLMNLLEMPEIPLLTLCLGRFSWFCKGLWFGVAPAQFVVTTGQAAIGRTSQVDLSYSIMMGPWFYLRSENVPLIYQAMTHSDVILAPDHN